MKTNSNASYTILRIKKVKVKTGLSNSTIYNKINPKSKYYDETFPQQVILGAASVGWVESEIDQWLEKRVHLSRSTQAI